MIAARGNVPRVRGSPYNRPSTSNAEMVAEKLRQDIKARRIFASSTQCVLSDTPVETTPTTTVGGGSDRTVSSARRGIADMRRINVGFETSQYYPVRVPSIESIARLLIAMAVGFPCFQIEMTKEDIASAFRMLRLHPALSLLMCTELPGGPLGRDHDLVLFYLAMPFGRNGSPASFALFGDAIPHMHSKIRNVATGLVRIVGFPVQTLRVRRDAVRFGD